MLAEQLELLSAREPDETARQMMLRLLLKGALAKQPAETLTEEEIDQLLRKSEGSAVPEAFHSPAIDR